jgi:hypothetical protein
MNSEHFQNDDPKETTIQTQYEDVLKRVDQNIDSIKEKKPSKALIAQIGKLKHPFFTLLEEGNPPSEIILKLQQITNLKEEISLKLNPTKDLTNDTFMRTYAKEVVFMLYDQHPNNVKINRLSLLNPEKFINDMVENELDRKKMHKITQYINLIDNMLQKLSNNVKDENETNNVNVINYINALNSGKEQLKILNDNLAILHHPKDFEMENTEDFIESANYITYQISSRHFDYGKNQLNIKNFDQHISERLKKESKRLKVNKLNKYIKIYKDCFNHIKNEHGKKDKFDIFLEKISFLISSLKVIKYSIEVKNETIKDYQLQADEVHTLDEKEKAELKIKITKAAKKIQDLIGSRDKLTNGKVEANKLAIFLVFMSQDPEEIKESTLNRLKGLITNLTSEVDKIKLKKEQKPIVKQASKLLGKYENFESLFPEPPIKKAEPGKFKNLGKKFMSNIFSDIKNSDSIVTDYSERKTKYLKEIKKKKNDILREVHPDLFETLKVPFPKIHQEILALSQAVSSHYEGLKEL